MPFPELPSLISQALAEQGYAEPTPVQAAVLEPEAQGRDLIVSAQTGSGKTVAFGLAMAREILAGDGPIPYPGAPLALVIAPTRELALQDHLRQFRPFGRLLELLRRCLGGLLLRQRDPWACGGDQYRNGGVRKDSR